MPNRYITPLPQRGANGRAIIIDELFQLVIIHLENCPKLNIFKDTGLNMLKFGTELAPNLILDFLPFVSLNPRS